MEREESFALLLKNLKCVWANRNVLDVDRIPTEKSRIVFSGGRKMLSRSLIGEAESI